jgi:hypothetical protein
MVARMLPARPWILAISFSSALLDLAPRAHAAEPAPRGDLEVTANVGTPLGGDDHADSFGTGLGIGVRGVYWLGGSPSWRAGLELCGQAIRSAYTVDLGGLAPSFDFDTDRFRGLLGVRVEVPLSPRFALTGRVLGGVEHFRSEELHISFGGAPAGTLRFSDNAPAAELGAGAQLAVGSLRFGAELALPVAFYGIDAPHHSDGATGITVYDDLVTETTVDLELRLTAGVRF